MYLIGYDIGTSSVKASLIEAESGKCVTSAFMPESEADIIAIKPGWAEQDPESWWTFLKLATAKLIKKTNVSNADIKAIGISYQMHGLVCVDKDLKPLRNAIIWCDGRAVAYGNLAFNHIGQNVCLSHLLNSPANFTAAKLAWVKDNEREIFDRIKYIMLPGDYIAMKFSGVPNTTITALSEGVFWDFKNNDISKHVMNYFGFHENIIPEIVPVFDIQSVVSKKAAEETGLKEGTPISYRAGDQPNNALSLNVFNPGEIAATAGTSGVVYGVIDKVAFDKLNRVNVFAHVNHSEKMTRLGVLLCINGTGILNAWMKRNITNNQSYNDINDIADTVSIGSDGLSVLPFGNGAERLLNNKNVGCSFEGLDFNIHNKSHLLRAAQEGIVFSFYKGIIVMKEMGLNVKTIHAGNANMFLSPVFRKTLASISGATIKLYDTDGAAGAAKAAGIGVGIYKNTDEAFSNLHLMAETTPDVENYDKYREAYELWNNRLKRHL